MARAPERAGTHPGEGQRAGESDRNTSAEKEQKQLLLVPVHLSWSSYGEGTAVLMGKEGRLSYGGEGDLGLIQGAAGPRREGGGHITNGEHSRDPQRQTEQPWLWTVSPVRA